MKRSELEGIIREEIKSALSEDEETKAEFGGGAGTTFTYDKTGNELIIKVSGTEVKLGAQSIFDLKQFLSDNTQ